MATRPITPQESELAQRVLANARRAMDQIAAYDQATVDRLCCRPPTVSEFHPAEPTDPVRAQRGGVCCCVAV